MWVQILRLVFRRVRLKVRKRRRKEEACGSDAFRTCEKYNFFIIVLNKSTDGRTVLPLIRFLK